MPVPTIPQTVVIGKISTYLSVAYNSNGIIYKSNRDTASPVTLAMITDALDWGYTGGAQSDMALVNTANYALWLYGMFGQEAQIISGMSGGGTVIPAGNNSLYPYTITGADFEADGITYNDPRVAGINISLFADQFNSNFLYAPDFFIYTTTGIQLVGWNANDFGTIRVDKLYT